MARLRVHNFTLSLDGFAAGPNQGVTQPVGEGGARLHDWIFQTATMRAAVGVEGGSTELNDRLVRARTENVGATIMGRNMFGPIRGTWGDESWKGWWGEAPPFGHDVFVLTHYPRNDVVMPNGTAFRFVDAEPRVVFERATQAAGERDVVLGGGPATIRQFLAAGLVDEIHLVVAPICLGAGERLFGDPVPAMEAYSCTPLGCEDGVTHVRLARD